MGSKQLSIFIPCFNEEQNLEATIDIVYAAAVKCLDKFEIIIVNDGSSDRSSEIANEIILNKKEVKLINFEKNAGFGTSYLKGFLSSSFPFALYLCADGDVTKNELEDLLRFWNGHDPLVQYCQNSSERFFYRSILSSIYTKVVAFLSRRNLPYYNGFNILPTNCDKEGLLMKDFGFSIQAYLLIYTIKNWKSVQIFGMQCRYNDVNSKALTLTNIKNSIRFFLYLTKKTLWT